MEKDTRDSGQALCVLFKVILVQVMAILGAVDCIIIVKLVSLHVFSVVAMY